MGCRIPVALIEAESSRMASSSNRRRGWNGLGEISEIGSSRTPGLSVVAVPLPPGMRASSPRPSACLGMLQHLPGQFAIALRPGAIGIIENDRLSKRRRLAQAHVPRNDAAVHAF